MKFPTTALALLLPLTLVTADSHRPVALEEGDPSVSPVISPAELFERATLVTCSIINVSSYVNCRDGPGTANKIIATAHNGDKYKFSCFAKGECINGNCTWDLLVWNGGRCWINGYYTSAACSMANLGTDC
ncbi:hypothetical protein BJX62DRAFT_243614 [Aspergillus germanicus]